jgi:hypothetical protein
MAKLNGRDILLVGLKGEKGDTVEVDKTLTKENEAADAKVVGDALNNKLDKVTSPDTVDRVYAIDVDGNQVVKTVTETPLSGAIPKYAKTGTLQSHYPKDIYDCANKDYVDLLLDAKADKATVNELSENLNMKADSIPTMDAINSKLDKNTNSGNYQIYGVNATGQQVMFQTGFYQASGRVPWYENANDKATGDVAPATPVSFRLANPTGAYHVANKQYVDNAVKLQKHNIDLYYNNVSGYGGTGIGFIEMHGWTLNRNSTAVSKDTLNSLSFLEIREGSMLLNGTWHEILGYDLLSKKIKYRISLSDAQKVEIADILASDICEIVDNIIEI